MTRKDTIVVAVMINSVILVALFLTAIKHDPIETAVEIKPIVFPEKIEEKQITVASGDAIDQVINDFSQQESVKKIDFAKELEAITKATAQKKSPGPAANVTSSLKEVTVSKGDTLAKIAQTHHTTIEALQTANHLSGTVLQIGQVLKIPTKEGEKAEKTEAGYYIVKQGDNPWTIAVKNHIKVDQLLKLNDLNEEKARKLRVGDRLRIR